MLNWVAAVNVGGEGLLRLRRPYYHAQPASKPPIHTTLTLMQIDCAHRTIVISENTTTANPHSARWER